MTSNKLMELQSDAEEKSSPRSVEDAAEKCKADCSPEEQQQNSLMEKCVKQKTPVKFSERDQLRYSMFN